MKTYVLNEQLLVAVNGLLNDYLNTDPKHSVYQKVISVQQAFVSEIQKQEKERREGEKKPVEEKAKEPQTKTEKK